MSEEGGDARERRDHLRLTRPGRASTFKAEKPKRPPYEPTGDREERATRLLEALRSVREAARDRSNLRLEGFEDAPGGVLLDIGAEPSVYHGALKQLESQSARIGVVRADAQGAWHVALVTDEPGIDKLERDVTAYRDELTEGGNPRQQQKIESIDRIAIGRLESLWGDSRPVPDDANDERRWWQCWCWKDRLEPFARAAALLGCPTNDDLRLQFPEIEVVPLHATRSELGRIVLSSGAVSELRLASDTPRFWMNMDGADQREWEQDLLDRVDWPPTDAPAVCLLDSGVNRAHPLIEPVLSKGDLLTVEPDWSAADDGAFPHGTLSAGLALYGDLVPVLAGTERVELTHRLESVKLVRTNEPEAHERASYGPITQQAISRAEINSPTRARVFSMPVTQDLTGIKPTSWSAALDQAAVGDGPSEEREHERPDGRLILVAAGNVEDGDVSVDAEADMERYDVLDPAQAWNVLTVGGFTNKSEIDDDEEVLDGYVTLANVGERSPYSRTSRSWRKRYSSTAIKPDIVFETGNLAVAPEGNYIAPRIDSLSLLTTGADAVSASFDTMWATSAAVPQAARVAAMVRARYPTLRAETIRALMVHGAEWTPAMRSRIDEANVTKRQAELRTFGYGVPRLERVLGSAANDLAIVTEETIVPYRLEKSRGQYNEMHLHELPWPVSTLQGLGATSIRLKVTLSYFVEPSPGRFGAVSASAYRSAGLRFALQRRAESLDEFVARKNPAVRDDDWENTGETDGGWLLGAKEVGNGSLHCNVWEGTAADLAARRHLCVYPVAGWWRDLPKLGRYDDSMHYSLVLSLETDSEDVDLYADITALLDTPVQIEA